MNCKYHKNVVFCSVLATIRGGSRIFEKGELTWEACKAKHKCIVFFGKKGGGAAPDEWPQIKLAVS